MNETEKEKVKEKIHVKMEELKARLEELYIATKPMGLDSAVGRLSRMDYINNKAIDEANIRSSEEKLKALERWLSLYDTDKFGMCTRCGKDININRLLFMPESTRCIQCADK